MSNSTHTYNELAEAWAASREYTATLKGTDEHFCPINIANGNMSSEVQDAENSSGLTLFTPTGSKVEIIPGEPGQQPPAFAVYSD